MTQKARKKEIFISNMAEGTFWVHDPANFSRIVEFETRREAKSFAKWVEKYGFFKAWEML